MKYKLVVKETAKSEIVEIAYQYENIQENLGYKFPRSAAYTPTYTRAPLLL